MQLDPRDQAELSRAWSIRRRELAAVRWARYRRLRRILSVPAVIGIGVLLYWLTLPMPVDEWPIGAGGLLLLMPLAALGGGHVTR